MKKVVLSCLLLVACIGGHSQEIGNAIALDYALNPMQSAGLYIPLKTGGRPIDQSQYLFSQWDENCQIFFSESKAFSIKNLNYNINTRKLESRMGKDSIFQFNVDKIDFVKRNGNKYKFYNFNDSNQLYQELYVSKNLIFLKGFKLIFKEAFINPMTNTVITEEKNVIFEKYFCKVADKEFLPLDLKKKAVLKLMGDKSSQVDKFVSDSKLNYSSENDLIKIFNYYDTL